MTQHHKHTNTSIKILSENSSLLAYMLASLIAVFTTPISASYTIEEPKQWITVQPWEPAESSSDSLATNGSFLKLFDLQINEVNPQVQGIYRLLEYKLTNDNGVSDMATIEIGYDTNYESITFHELSLIRDGQTLDQLSNTNFEQIRTKEQLSLAPRTNYTTLTAIVQEARVGDVLRYSYTVNGKNPILGNIVEHGLATQHYSSIGKINFTLHVDASIKTVVRTQDLDDDFKLNETTNNGVRTYSWSAALPEIVKEIEDQPTWDEYDPAFAVSSINNWDDIVAWQLPHYDIAEIQSTELQSIANEITDKYQSRGEQIGAAVQWVQNELRYIGVAMRDSSSKPSHPDETLKRQSADRKDRVLLLIALLRELDVEAQAALVNTEQRQRRDDYIYRANAFNHVIVRVQHDNNTHWLDPSDLYQAGKLGEFYEPDYGFALVLDGNTTDLTSMTNSYTKGHVKITRNVHVSDIATFEIITERSFSSAEKFRKTISNNDMQIVSEDYLDYYRELYGDIERAEPMSVKELPGNKIRTREVYTLLNPWRTDEDQESSFYVGTDEIYSSLKTPTSPKQRTHSFYIGFPFKLEETTILHFPNIKQDGTFANEITNDFFDYHLQIEQDKSGNTVTIAHQYESKALSVNAEEIQAYTDIIEVLKTWLYWDVQAVGLHWWPWSKSKTPESTKISFADQVLDFLESLE